MKRYATTYSTGHTVETSAPHEAANWQNYDDAQRFFLAGKPVPPAAFYAAVNAARDAALAKKEQTHRQVRVLHGSSAGCYVSKWIRR